MNDNAIIIDLETLCHEPTAVIVALTIIIFSWEDLNNSENPIEYLRERHLTLRFNTKEQYKQYNRTISQNVLDFWKKEPEAWEIVQNTGEYIENSSDIYQKLVSFIEKHDYNYNQSFIWIRGTDFDQPILKNFFKTVNNIDNTPWNNWKVRDIRTLCDIASGGHTGYIKDSSGKRLVDVFMDKYDLVKHDSFSDCVLDILQMQSVLFED